MSNASLSPTLTGSQAPEWRLPIDGMTCASCVRRVENALARVPGVQDVAVNLATEQATLHADSGAVLPAAAKAVADAGYEVPRETLELNIADMTCASCVAARRTGAARRARRARCPGQPGDRARKA